MPVYIVPPFAGNCRHFYGELFCVGRVKKGPWAPAVLHRIHKRTTFGRSGCVEWISREYMCVNYLRVTMERRKTPGFWRSHFFLLCFFFFTFFIRSAAYAFEYVFVVFLVRPSGVHESGFDGRRIDAHAFWNEARQALISFLFFPRRILKSIWRKASVFLNGGVGLKKKKSSLKVRRKW